MKRNAIHPLPPRQRILTRGGLFFACFFFFWISNAISNAAVYNWNHSGSGLWTGTSNWTPGGSPGPGDSATISQGTVEMDTSPYTFPGYTIYQTNTDIYLSGGELRSYGYTGSGTLHVRGINIGTVNGADVTVQQTGGAILTNWLGIGNDWTDPGASIKVNYTMTGGTLDTDQLYVATGENVSAAVTFSDSASVNVASFVNIGDAAGKGTLNLSGNASLTVHNTEFCLGTDEGTGIVNISENATVDTQGYFVGGWGYGIGISNHTGGTLKAWETWIGGWEATGTVNLSDGTLYSADFANVGFGTGNGVVNQTGGLFRVGGCTDIGYYGPEQGMFNIGYELDEDGQGIYNMRGGELRCEGVVTIGMNSESSSDSLAQWNIYDGSVVNLFLTPVPPHQQEQIISGNLHIGYTEDAGGSSPKELARSELNIYGGDINIQGDIIGYHNKSYLNISGSTASIHVGNIWTDGVFDSFGNTSETFMGCLDVNFLLDSHGASTIHCDSIALGMSCPDVDINIPGFLSMKADSTDLIRATGAVTGVRIKDNTPFRFVETRPTEGGDTIVRLTMAGDHDTWDLTGVWEVFNGMNPDGKESGALKVTGSASVPLHAIFTGLDGLADVLVEYLNSVDVETSLHFSKINETTLLLDGDYLNGDGYAWFGWDLSGFNMDNSSGVKLYQFNALEPFGEGDVPEPSTWAMLLLGGAAMAGMRLRRRK